MDTLKLIERIKCNTRRESEVALRFALYNNLYKNGVSVCIISSIMGVCRGSVYNGINQHRQKLDVNDKIAISAESEIQQHDICVKPCFVKINPYFVRQKGNVMVIDNKIF